jgi:hypothetical protein
MVPAIFLNRPGKSRIRIVGFGMSWQNMWRKRALKGKYRPTGYVIFLLAWLKKQGVEDSHIQAYSGQLTRQSLGVYSEVSVEDTQKEYNRIIGKIPV